MFRIGIVGSDNSHAIAFSQLLNREEGYNGMHVEGARVTHLYGVEPERTREVADLGEIPEIVVETEHMMGDVDGIICVLRDGALHKDAVLPFLKAGMPVFVDKPLATTVADVDAMIDAAQRTGVGFSSFSTVRYELGVQAWIAEARENEGEAITGVSTSPGDLESEYSGIFFYGIHAVELMHERFGYGVREVTAIPSGRSVQAVCRFEDGLLVTLNLVHGGRPGFRVASFGQRGASEHIVDFTTNYRDGLTIALEVLKQGVWPFTPEQLREPVATLAAINESIAQGGPVALA
jgi:predicted dehydrogenase